MIRALGLIADFELQAPGTIFLIDELETSLGVNCLPAIADLINDKKSEFQIVVTSHHPYIINNIPAENWKVVTRAGSTVRVMDYDSLPALHTQSRHERFIQLINLPEYEDGIR
ncbi:MAG: hypothetical protein BWZ10_02765 [candidate division BRC1 bacterium ADurb.BinA364]|nr:MAG: hypothetical protein BWZ10_02765 [candidate division BRC1 bacterium ADurb.BinA364]